ncbi:MAG: oligosaccharide flippase family protein [Anaerolineales bacterium]|nr:oligosaccharide flippase family protein [Anaerolineales bacterium]
MRQKLHQFLKRALGMDILEILSHSRNYFIGSALSQTLTFVALPVLTQILTPSDYGVYQVFRSYAEIFIVLLTLNVHGAVSRYYYDSKEDFEEFVGSSALGSALILLLPALLFVLFPRKIASFLTIPQSLILPLLILICAKIVESIFNQISTASKKSVEYAFVNNARAVLTLLLGIGLSLAMKQDKYYGLAAGQAIGSVMVGIYAFILIRKQVKWTLRKSHFIFIASYSLPLIPYFLSTMLLDKLDRILINKILDPASAGLYSFAYNIGMLVSMATDSFNSAFVPDWFKLMREEKYDAVNSLILRMLKIVLLISLGAILFSQEVFGWLSSAEYSQAFSILPIVVIGYVFDFLSKIYLRNIALANKMIYASLIGIGSVALNFGLNWVLLPLYGYQAGAYTTVASYVFVTVCAWVVARYVLKQTTTPWKVFLRPLTVFFVFVALSFIVSHLDLNLLLFWTLKALIMLLFALALAFESLKKNKMMA